MEQSVPSYSTRQARGTAYKLFFSHGGEDTYLADTFFRPRLEGAGAAVFFDLGKLQYGDEFRQTIFNELRACQELVAFLTPQSLRRPWVFAEMGAIAVQEGKRVCAMRYGTSDADLQALGVLSILGNNSPFPIDRFDAYCKQLTSRVAEHHQND